MFQLVFDSEVKVVSETIHFQAVTEIFSRLDVQTSLNQGNFLRERSLHCSAVLALFLTLSSQPEKRADDGQNQ